MIAVSAPVAQVLRSAQAVTGLAMDLYAGDLFITVGVLANTLALVWLGAEVIPRRLAHRRRTVIAEGTAPAPTRG
jgi:hypothetical protein